VLCSIEEASTQYSVLESVSWHEVAFDSLEWSMAVSIRRVHGIQSDVLGVPSVRC